MKKILAVAAIFSLAAGYVAAQVYPTVPQVVSVGDTDLFLDVVHGAPASPAQYATAAQINAAPGVQTLIAPIGGFTLTVNDAANYVYIQPAGGITAGTITLPSHPGNGQHVCFWSTQTISATLTYAVVTGQTLSSTPSVPTSATASTQYCFRYIMPIATWYYTATG